MDESEIKTVPLDSSLVITPPASLSNIHFHDKNAQILMTITHDGRLEIGPGLSPARATQEVAKLLVDMFEKTLTDRTRETFNPNRRIK